MILAYRLTIVNYRDFTRKRTVCLFHRPFPRTKISFNAFFKYKINIKWKRALISKNPSSRFFIFFQWATFTITRTSARTTWSALSFKTAYDIEYYRKYHQRNCQNGYYYFQSVHDFTLLLLVRPFKTTFFLSNNNTVIIAINARHTIKASHHL